jgi:hypothetical protein
VGELGDESVENGRRVWGIGCDKGSKTWQDLEMRKTRRLLDEYRFPGFRPKAAMQGIFGKPEFRVIQLERRQKNALRFLRHLPLDEGGYRRASVFEV